MFATHCPFLRRGKCQERRVGRKSWSGVPTPFRKGASLEISRASSIVSVPLRCPGLCLRPTVQWQRRLGTQSTLDAKDKDNANGASTCGAVRAAPQHDHRFG